MNVDVLYYTTEFKGKIIPQEQIEYFLEGATYDIHTLTFNRTVNPSNLTPFQLNLIKRAICSQAEHNYLRNDVSGLNIQSISSDGSAISYAKGESTRFSRVARDLVLSSGLAYAGFS